MISNLNQNCHFPRKQCAKYEIDNLVDALFSSNVKNQEIIEEKAEEISAANKEKPYQQAITANKIIEEKAEFNVMPIPAGM